MTTPVNVKATQVNRAISGATTVAANCYAMVTYTAGTPGLPSGTPSTNGSGGVAVIAPMAAITVWFGPGQSIPSSFSQTCMVAVAAGNGAFASQSSTVTYSLNSGVEFINTGS